MAVSGGDLYVGSLNTTTGAEVWRSSDSTTWTQVNPNGFGDANNVWAYSMVGFGDDLYIGTGNPATGAEVWRPGEPEEVAPVGGVSFAQIPAVAPLVGVGLVLGVAALGGAVWYVRRRR